MEERKKVTILCVNDGVRHKVEEGISLKEISEKWCPKVKDGSKGESYPVLAALVDHRLRNLDYEVFDAHTVEFVSYIQPEGRRTYIRSLCFVLQKAVRELYPEKILRIEHSIPSGLYCELEEVQDGEENSRPYFLLDEELEAINTRMKEIISADYPFSRKKVAAEEAIEIFNKHGQKGKAKLTKSIGKFSVDMYYLDGMADTFYAPLTPSTGYLTQFSLSGFDKGFCLQLPAMGQFDKIIPMKRQSKIAASLEANAEWGKTIGLSSVGTLNTAINMGYASKVINIEEARHERKYAEIADMISQRKGQLKFIFIAGPSSSGKTSSSLRIALQCQVLGLNPKVIELDNYFVNREDTPLDENGEYDYESLHAMDLNYLNQQLNELLEGKEVETPIFDFKRGCRSETGKKLKLEENDILIMEGIHALNPEMTSAVDSSRIFRVYVSALTSLNLDENNHISTSDNRLLRRMVRDNRTRGVDPEGTIMRWASVRRGEVRNIFPYQENSDVIFNSAMLFELPMLKYYAEPLLRRIAPNSPAYPEAYRMLKFLSHIKELQPSEIACIPPISIMREFIGGQTL